MRGDSSTETLSGPPDKITPIGANCLTSSDVSVNGKISQYTPISRTRRAMSCVYCEPKSMIKIR